MKQVTVYITDKKYTHFVELVKSLGYVKKVEDEASKKIILKGIEEGLKEVKLIKTGKKKAKSLNEFLREL
jgi:hypothetical protein